MTAGDGIWMGGGTGGRGEVRNRIVKLAKGQKKTNRGSTGNVKVAKNAVVSMHEDGSGRGKEQDSILEVKGANGGKQVGDMLDSVCSRKSVTAVVNENCVNVCKESERDITGTNQETDDVETVNMYRELLLEVTGNSHESKQGLSKVNDDIVHALVPTYVPTAGEKEIGVIWHGGDDKEIVVPRGHLRADCSAEEYFEVVSKVSKTGKANHEEARVSLGSSLNIPLWTEKLQHYRDKHLVNLLNFGFPLGILEHERLNRHWVNNHSTAREHMEEVDKYISKEGTLGALLGPFKEVPHSEFHCSPLLTRYKDEQNRRVIVDLSYGEEAVNSFTERGTYEGRGVSLHLPGLDQLISEVLSQHSPLLVKADVSRAFRNIPVDPRDAIKCGIVHRNTFFCDKRLVFGAVNGTLIFQRVSDGIRYILGQEGIRICNYIDDTFASFEKEGAKRKFERICGLIQALGLPLNKDKVQGPTTCMEIMGIEVDVVKRTLAIGEKKLQEIIHKCEAFEGKQEVHKTELQSLLGKLLYVSKIIRPARGFLNRMLNTLRRAQQKVVHLDEGFHKELAWFRVFLSHFNGRTSFANWGDKVEGEIFVDASLHGLGAWFDGEFYSKALPGYVKTQERIVVFEMINVLVALRVWADKIQGQRIDIWCDNSAVVSVCASGKTRDGELGIILREILMLVAEKNVELKVKHIRGESDEHADALSRVHMGKCSECIHNLLSEGFVRRHVGDELFAFNEMLL